MLKLQLFASLASVVIACCVAAEGLAAPAAADHPNIVVILADDMGYGDVKCNYPDGKIPTPHLDRLASQGMRFTDAHAPSSLCTPTRYALLTGRYAWRTRLKSGVLWQYDKPLIEAQRLTLPAMLKQHGYRTAAVGKWHLGMNWPFSSAESAKKSRQEQRLGHLRRHRLEPTDHRRTDRPRLRLLLRGQCTQLLAVCIHRE